MKTMNFLMVFSNFDFSKLLNVKRIFEGAPSPSFQYFQELLIFFVLLFLGAVGLQICSLYKKNRVKKKIIKKIRSLFYWTSLLGFLYLLMRWQGIYLFSSRAFLYLIFVIFFIRAGYIAYYFFFKYPEELKKNEREMIIKKYIPKPKKKGRK